MAFEENRSIGLFIDGGYYAKINEGLEKTSGKNVNIKALVEFIPDWITRKEGLAPGKAFITESHYYRGRYRVNDASDRNLLYTERQFAYLANLDVQAVYTVNSASLSDLSTDASLTQSTVKVNCLMNLTGSLANPTIKFDLELPTVSEEDRELVRSATSTEEQMNTQIIYLLGIGKFYAYDYNANSNRSSSATSSLAFSTLSGQLNNMLSQAMENENSWSDCNSQNARH